MTHTKNKPQHTKTKKPLKELEKTVTNSIKSKLGLTKKHLIATIPRSGTWYITYILHCYYTLLRDEEPNLEEMIKLQVGNTIDDIVVMHTTHPDSNLQQSDFNMPGYNWGTNKDKWASITFVYRKKKYQIDSYYKHTRDHKEKFPEDSYQFYVKASDDYDKMLATYINTEANIITYEKLIEDPSRQMYQMLTAMGKEPDWFLLDKAVKMCTKEAIKDAEQRAGKSLANDAGRIHHATGAV